MFYSRSTGGFYASEIHGDNIPKDAVEITAEQHQTLLAGQSAGKVIVADEHGHPVLVDPVPAMPSVEQIIKEQRRRLTATLWTQAPDEREAMGAEQAAQWDAYRAALRAVVKDLKEPMFVEWPEEPTMS